MTIINPIALVGDFLATIPATLSYLTKYPGTTVVCDPAVKSLVDILPKKIRRRIVYERNNDNITITLDVQRGWRYSLDPKNLYMGSCFYAQLGLKIDTGKIDLVIKDMETKKFDYVISPFARSLPPEQKVYQSSWQGFIDMNPHLSFCFLGCGTHDDPAYLTGDNVEPFFDKSWTEVSNVILKSKALISVVTGTSHLAYHLSHPNVVISNQGFVWGTNPDSIKNGLVIRKYIPEITAEDLNNFIQSKL